MTSGVINAGAIGRLTAASSVTGATDKIPVYQAGVLKYATPDQIALGQDAVVGPASATDNAIARFDGTTGELVQNSVVLIADTTGNVTGMGTLACAAITQTGAGANTFNSTSLDADFTVKKLTSGNAIAFDAGTVDLQLASTTIGFTGITTQTGNFTHTGAGAVTFNNGAADADFTVKKLTSGNAIAYDAGAASLALDSTTVGITGAITLTGDVGIAGASSELSIAKTTNQLVLGTTNTTTLNAAAPAASITSNLPLVSGTIATTTGANLFYADVTRCTSSLTKNASTTYANITGLSQAVVVGTYRFVCRLPSTVANGTGGIKYAFNYTTAVLSAIEATGRGFTSAAVAVQHTTTTTTQTDLFTQAAVVIYTEISGTMTVSTGGTVDMQMAQNTSDGSNTVTLVGASMEFIRIA